MSSAREARRRIVCIVEVASDDAAREQSRAARSLACADIVLCVLHPSTDATRDSLVALAREGAPIIVIDTPHRAPLSRRHRLSLHRNVRRFFDPAALVHVGPRGMLPWRSREEIVACLDRGEGTAGSGAFTMLRREDLARLDGVPAGHEGQEEPRGGRGEPRPPCRSVLASRVRRLTNATRRLLRQSGRRSLDGTAMPGGIVTLPGGVTGRLQPAGGNAVGERSGVLSAGFHLDNFYLDCPPFRYVADKYGPASVLDVGCGLGGYVLLFRQWGARDAIGVDGVEVTLCRENYLSHDLRTPLFLHRRFDLVICTEVAEHLDAASADTLLASILRHAGSLIVFSAARPGQPGQGHVNCQPVEYWLARFSAAGWEPEPFDTVAVRSLSTFFWFRRNLLVLRPRGLVSPGPIAAADLESYETGAVRWVDQPPAVHAYALEHPPPRIA